jgi:hypothetical protein
VVKKNTNRSAATLASRLRNLLTRKDRGMGDVTAPRQAEEPPPAAGLLAELADADRVAAELLAAVTRETILANTPLEVRLPDAGYGPDDFPEDHSGEAIDRLEAHLRSHPELRTVPRWVNDYTALDRDDADRAALDAR